MTDADARKVRASMSISLIPPYPLKGAIGLLERYMDGVPTAGIWVTPAWVPAIASGIVFGKPDSQSVFWTIRSHCVEFDRLPSDNIAYVGGLKRLFFFWAQLRILHSISLDDRDPTWRSV